MMYKATEASLTTILGSAKTFCNYDTYQLPDYPKVVMEIMDPAKKETKPGDRLLFTKRSEKNQSPQAVQERSICLTDNG